MRLKSILTPWYTADIYLQDFSLCVDSSLLTSYSQLIFSLLIYFIFLHFVIFPVLVTFYPFPRLFSLLALPHPFILICSLTSVDRPNSQANLSPRPELRSVFLGLFRYCWNERTQVHFNTHTET